MLAEPDRRRSANNAEPRLTEHQITNKYSNLAFYLGERGITAAFSIRTSQRAQNKGINRSKETNDAQVPDFRRPGRHRTDRGRPGRRAVRAALSALRQRLWL